MAYRILLSKCPKCPPVPVPMFIQGDFACFFVVVVYFYISSVAWGWGDPHISTLDGRVYTFNGWGEYILADVTVLGSFQGRTSLVSGSNATQFSAFAFGNMSVCVEVSLNHTQSYLKFSGTAATLSVHA